MSVKAPVIYKVNDEDKYLQSTIYVSSTSIKTK